MDLNNCPTDQLIRLGGLSITIASTLLIFIIKRKFISDILCKTGNNMSVTVQICVILFLSYGIISSIGCIFNAIYRIVGIPHYNCRYIDIAECLFFMAPQRLILDIFFAITLSIPMDEHRVILSDTSTPKMIFKYMFQRLSRRLIICLLITQYLTCILWTFTVESLPILLCDTTYCKHSGNRKLTIAYWCTDGSVTLTILLIFSVYVWKYRNNKKIFKHICQTWLLGIATFVSSLLFVLPSTLHVDSTTDFAQLLMYLRALTHIDHIINLICMSWILNTCLKLSQRSRSNTIDNEKKNAKQQSTTTENVTNTADNLSEITTTNCVEIKIHTNIQQSSTAVDANVLYSHKDSAYYEEESNK